ncbi:hypothetical protein CYVG_00031 [Cyanophage S-SSM6a]|uniref:Peptidase n=1 Tax=Synechococcus phage S-SSM7 TaxID=445686 RepID=E3SL79_9CAUD|nr:peptidase [Synechococcus phage S-SSM7]ADO98227.1 peptidase [Synechococcus phage S-SSM7]AGH07475.1 hypothetical protein CYVG_00031 [Cyanophage S-SSM6a]
MLKKVNYEVKGQLAKLLATEDLIIENKRVPTASFDVDRRVLTLPMWDKASATVYDLLVGHEVGHALYTPNENWKLRYPEVPMSFVNILEDVRIEKLMKRKYAGIVKTFHMGYKELSDQDFFELGENEVEDMNLPDRINIHHKIGKFVDVPMSEDEVYFRDSALNTDTFDEVLELANELHEFMKTQHTESIKIDLPFDGAEMEQGGGSKVDPIPSEDKSDSFDSIESESSDGEESEEQESGDNSDETTGFPPEFSDSPIGGEHCDFETITDKLFSDNLENLNDKNRNTGVYDTDYCTIPELNLETVKAKNADVHKHLDEEWIAQQQHYDNELLKEENKYRIPMNLYASVDNEYRLFRRSAQKEVNYLVKEFECRKSADAYARATVSKTGVLDCTKLHSYKYNEDLFKKVTTLPDGKNHGLIFVLDWSGSMSNVLKDTVKQLFNLIWFCKKVQIPFQVFAFTNEWNRGDKQFDEYGNYRGYAYPKDHHVKKDGQLYIEAQFAMVEFLTSDCKKGDLEHQMMNIWRLMSCLDQRGRWDSSVYYQCPSRLSLSGTPLNEALVSLNQIIPEFKKKTGVQKIQCITLTDGEAHPLKFHKEFKSRQGNEQYLGTRSAHGNVFIRDKNGRTYHCADAYYDLTTALLNQLRGRFPDVNFLGIRVVDNRDCNSFVRRYVDYDYERHQTIMAQWRKTKSLMITEGGGYHAYFGLSSSALNSDSSFEVKEDATKAQIKSAFKKSLSAKKMNKKVLGQFMSYIA